jgi:hypothetical protein
LSEKEEVVALNRYVLLEKVEQQQEQQQEKEDLGILLPKEENTTKAFEEYGVYRIVHNNVKVIVQNRLVQEVVYNGKEYSFIKLEQIPLMVKDGNLAKSEEPYIYGPPQVIFTLNSNK